MKSVLCLEVAPTLETMSKYWGEGGGGMGCHQQVGRHQWVPGGHKSCCVTHRRCGA